MLRNCTSAFAAESLPARFAQIPPRAHTSSCGYAHSFEPPGSVAYWNSQSQGAKFVQVPPQALIHFQMVILLRSGHLDQLLIVTVMSMVTIRARELLLLKLCQRGLSKCPHRLIHLKMVMLLPSAHLDQLLIGTDTSIVTISIFTLLGWSSHFGNSRCLC